MPTLKTRGARRLGVAAVAASLVVAPLVAGVSTATADETTTVPLTLQWEISERFDTHLASHELGDGATEDADGVITFPGGVGTYDTATGEASVAYQGSVAGSFGPNFGLPKQYTITVADPVVTVDADGAGEITAVVSAWNTGGMGGSEASTEPARVLVTTFDAGEGWADGDGVGTLGATPDWAGVLPAGSAEATALGIPPGQPVDGQSFAPEFLGQLTPGVRAHFYASGSGSDGQKDPSPFVAQAEPEAEPAPAVTWTTTSSTYDGGLVLSASGTGFRAVTNPGDDGVYVGLAEAGGLPDVSSPAGAAAFAGVAYVRSGQIVDGAFTASVTSPTDKLDPTRSYALYTWQAHTHSNTTQDTETPVTIDWATLAAPEPEAEPEVALSFVGSVGQRYGSSATVGVAVEGVESGTVTLTGLGATQQSAVVDGLALFRVPTTLPVAWHQATFVLAAGESTAQLVQRFGVSRSTMNVGSSFRVTPGPNRNGSVLIGVSPYSNAGAAAPQATGYVALKLLVGGRQVWYSGAQPLVGGTRTFTLPRLAPGSYVLQTLYAGTSTYLPTTAQRPVTVR